MMAFIRVFLTVILYVLTSAQSDSRVKVSVYYETLCPDSIAFIRYQLFPTFEAIPEILNADLVPFGKASYKVEDDGNVTFRCQHGPRECGGNMMQACAIDALGYNQSSVIPFVNCLKKQRRPDMAGPKCAQQLGIDYEPIRTCTEGTKGQQLLMEAGRKTLGLSPRLNFVPWININDQHSEEIQDGALADLVRLVCLKYEGEDAPDKCDQYRPKPTRQGHTPAPTTTNTP